jgi:PAS domain S-box-containing protein
MNTRPRKGAAALLRRLPGRIAARHRAGADLETRLRLAIESTRAGTHSRDLVSDRAVWSPRLREIYDLADGEPATSEVWLSRIHPDDRAHARNAMLRAMDPAGDGNYRATFRVVRRDGSQRWVEGHGQIAFDVVEGRRRPVRMAGLSFDVTERMALMAALRDSEDRLQLAMHSAGLGVFDWDVVGDTMQWSGATRRMFGFGDDEPITTEAVMARVCPDDRAPMREAVAAALSPHGDGEFRLRYRVLRPDGSIRWLDGAALVRFDDVRGAPRRALRVCGVVSDVTDAETMVQSLREADRRKDEFLAMLAHELRNPLAPLVTAQQVIARSGSLGQTERAALAIAQRQARQLARLVDDLLEVSRITQGRIGLRPEPMRLADAVTGAAESAGPEIAARGQTLVLRMPAPTPRVVADASRIVQVLGNLLNNASKYSADGGEIRVEVAADGDDAVVSVSDDGIGIAPERLDAIFELFAQEDATLDRSRGGLGIGLALAQRLAAMHGGSVRADSAGHGRGSTFTLRLPRAGPPDRSRGLPDEGFSPRP